MGFVFDCPPNVQQDNRGDTETDGVSALWLVLPFFFFLYINICVIIKSRSLVVHLPSIYMFTSCLLVYYVAGLCEFKRRRSHFIFVVLGKWQIKWKLLMRFSERSQLSFFQTLILCRSFELDLRTVSGLMQVNEIRCCLGGVLHKKVWSQRSSLPAPLPYKSGGISFFFFFFLQ